MAFRITIFNLKEYIERQGLKYLVYLSQKDETNDQLRHLRKIELNGLPMFPTTRKERLAEQLLMVARRDRDIANAYRWITWGSMVIAFILGAVSAISSVYIDELLVYLPNWKRLAFVLLWTCAATLIEVFLLSWLSIHCAYIFARLLGYNSGNIQEKIFLDEKVGVLLARAALELSDPVKRYLGVDPLINASKGKLLFFSLLYKAKVFLSNLFGRIVMGKILGSYINLGKTGAVISVAYITAPITGVWNAIVIYKVYQEMSLRLLGAAVARQVAYELAQIHEQTPISKEGREACLRAVANSVTLTQNYHPNMIALLAPIHQVVDIVMPDDLVNFKRFSLLLNFIPAHEKQLALKILQISIAFDGKISELERRSAGEILSDTDQQLFWNQVQAIKDSMKSGKLSVAKKLCRLHTNNDSVPL